MSNDDRVIQTDNWTRYIWRHHVEPAEDVKSVLDEGAARYESFPAFGREIFGRLFSPKKEERVEQVRPEDAWQVRAHDELSELPGWSSLVKRATGDTLLAATAATAMAEKVLANLPAPTSKVADADALRRRVRGLLHMVREGIGDGAELQVLITQARAEGQAAVANANAYANELDESVLRDALRAAVTAAHTQLDEVEAELSGFCGWGQGTMRAGGDGDEKAKLAAALKQSEKLQRLGVMAGRMRRIAMLKRRSRSSHARDEVSDIERGSDLGRVLPSELVKLTDPMLAVDFARAFVEGTLVQYRLHGRERQGRGPVVICVDSSGSMEGEREVWSKAVALALMQLALADKRRCRIVQFDDGVRRVDDFLPGRVDAASVMAAMAPFFGGGTDFEEPLSKAMEAITEDTGLRRADVVLITDGEAIVTDGFRASWAEAKRKHEVTVFAVAIGGTVPAVLHQVADHVLALKELTDDNDALQVLFAGVSKDGGR
jgi:uncharacterized protein with von Willebrand factor type A (vWA) domain